MSKKFCACRSPGKNSADSDEEKIKKVVEDDNDYEDVTEVQEHDPDNIKVDNNNEEH